MDIKKCVHRKNRSRDCNMTKNNSPVEQRRVHCLPKFTKICCNNARDNPELLQARCPSPKVARMCKKLIKDTFMKEASFGVRYESLPHSHKKQENRDPNECYNTMRLSTRCPEKCIKSEKWKRRNDSEQVAASLQPNLYLDTDSDDEFSTTVRKTKSKIKWSNPKKSRFHKKCTTNENSMNRFPKRTEYKKSTISSDKQIKINLMSELEDEIYMNECYCQQDPCKPLLCNKARLKKYDCSSDGGVDYEFDTFPAMCSNYSLDTLQKAKEVIDYCPESTFLKRLYNCTKKTYDCNCLSCRNERWANCLQFTDRRNRIEQAYKELEDELENYNLCRHKCPSASCSTEVNYDDSSDNCKWDNEPKIGRVCYRVRDAESIRSKNYFDTHSTDNLSSNCIPPHRCIHKFKLDDRLLPEPLNADCYGTSRCSLCEKPIEGCKKKGSISALHKENCQRLTLTQTNLNSNLSSNNSKSSLKRNPVTFCNAPSYSSKSLSDTCLSKSDAATCVTKSCDSPYLRKRTINIGCNDDSIDLKINTDNCDENTSTSDRYFLEKVTMKIKPFVVPNDSLALRYQRGVI